MTADKKFPKIFRILYSIILKIILRNKDLYSVELAINLDSKPKILSLIYRRYHALEYITEFKEKNFENSICSMVMIKISQLNTNAHNAKEYLKIFIKKDSIKILRKKIQDIQSLVYMLDIDLDYNVRLSNNKPEINIIGPMDENNNEDKIIADVNYYFKMREKYYKGKNILFINDNDWFKKFTKENTRDVELIIARNKQHKDSYNKIPIKLAIENKIHMNLLALNRLLYHLSKSNEGLSINILAINYYLSKKTHSEEYNASCFNDFINSRDEKNFESMIEHDLFFNFMYTRYIINKNEFKIYKSEFFEIITLELDNYISAYKENLEIRVY